MNERKWLVVRVDVTNMNASTIKDLALEMCVQAEDFETEVNANVETKAGHLLRKVETLWETCCKATKERLEDDGN